MRVESFTSQSFYSPNSAGHKIQRPPISTDEEPPDENRTETVKLKNRDQEVRRHEQAHLAAAGGLATGGANFSYQTGPDGKRYAIGGEVNIDTSPVPGDPNATIRKAQQIRKAALAPADPSPQDRAVAASASAMEIKARRDLQEKNREEPAEETSQPTRKIHLYI